MDNKTWREKVERAVGQAVWTTLEKLHITQSMPFSEFQDTLANAGMSTLEIEELKENVLFQPGS